MEPKEAPIPNLEQVVQQAIEKSMRQSVEQSIEQGTSSQAGRIPTGNEISDQMVDAIVDGVIEKCLEQDEVPIQEALSSIGPTLQRVLVEPSLKKVVKESTHRSIAQGIEFCLEQGLERGFITDRREAVKELLRTGLSLETIKQGTGYSEEELRALQEEL